MFPEDITTKEIFPEEKFPAEMKTEEEKILGEVKIPEVTIQEFRPESITEELVDMQLFDVDEQRQIVEKHLVEQESLPGVIMVEELADQKMEDEAEEKEEQISVEQSNLLVIENLTRQIAHSADDDEQQRLSIGHPPPLSPLNSEDHELSGMEEGSEEGSTHTVINRHEQITEEDQLDGSRTRSLYGAFAPDQDEEELRSQTPTTPVMTAARWKSMEEEQFPVLQQQQQQYPTSLISSPSPLIEITPAPDEPEEEYEDYLRGYETRQHAESHEEEVKQIQGTNFEEEAEEVHGPSPEEEVEEVHEMSHDQEVDKVHGTSPEEEVEEVHGASHGDRVMPTIEEGEALTDQHSFGDATEKDVSTGQQHLMESKTLEQEEFEQLPVETISDHQFMEAEVGEDEAVHATLLVDSEPVLVEVEASPMHSPPLSRASFRSESEPTLDETAKLDQQIGPVPEQAGDEQKIVEIDDALTTFSQIYGEERTFAPAEIQEQLIEPLPTMEEFTATAEGNQTDIGEPENVMIVEHEVEAVSAPTKAASETEEEWVQPIEEVVELAEPWPKSGNFVGTGDALLVESEEVPLNARDKLLDLKLDQQQQQQRPDSLMFSPGGEKHDAEETRALQTVTEQQAHQLVEEVLEQVLSDESSLRSYMGTPSSVDGGLKCSPTRPTSGREGQSREEVREWPEDIRVTPAIGLEEEIPPHPRASPQREPEETAQEEWEMVSAHEAVEQSPSAQQSPRELAHIPEEYAFVEKADITDAETNEQIDPFEKAEAMEKHLTKGDEADKPAKVTPVPTYETELGTPFDQETDTEQHGVDQKADQAVPQLIEPVQTPGEEKAEQFGAESTTYLTDFGNEPGIFDVGVEQKVEIIEEVVVEQQLGQAVPGQSGEAAPAEEDRVEDILVDVDIAAPTEHMNKVPMRAQFTVGSSGDDTVWMEQEEEEEAAADVQDEEDEPELAQIQYEEEDEQDELENDEEDEEEGNQIVDISTEIGEFPVEHQHQKTGTEGPSFLGLSPIFRRPKSPIPPPAAPTPPQLRQMTEEQQEEVQQQTEEEVQQQQHHAQAVHGEEEELQQHQVQAVHADEAEEEEPQHRIQAVPRDEHEQEEQQQKQHHVQAVHADKEEEEERQHHVQAVPRAEHEQEEQKQHHVHETHGDEEGQEHHVQAVHRNEKEEEQHQQQHHAQAVPRDEHENEEQQQRHPHVHAVHGDEEEEEEMFLLHEGTSKEPMNIIDVEDDEDSYEDKQKNRGITLFEEEQHQKIEPMQQHHRAASDLSKEETSDEQSAELVSGSVSAGSVGSSPAKRQHRSSQEIVGSTNGSLLEFERIEREIHEVGTDQHNGERSPQSDKGRTELVAAAIAAARGSAESISGSLSSLTEFEQLEREVLRDAQAAEEAAAAVMMLSDIREESDDGIMEEEEKRAAIPLHHAHDDDDDDVERMSTGADDEEEDAQQKKQPPLTHADDDADDKFILSTAAHQFDTTTHGGHSSSKKDEHFLMTEKEIADSVAADMQCSVDSLEMVKAEQHQQQQQPMHKQQQHQSELMVEQQQMMDTSVDSLEFGGTKFVPDTAQQQEQQQQLLLSVERDSLSSAQSDQQHDDRQLEEEEEEEVQHQHKLEQYSSTDIGDIKSEPKQQQEQQKMKTEPEHPTSYSPPSTLGPMAGGNGNGSPVGVSVGDETVQAEMRQMRRDFSKDSHRGCDKNVPEQASSPHHFTAAFSMGGGNGNLGASGDDNDGYNERTVYATTVPGDDVQQQRRIVRTVTTRVRDPVHTRVRFVDTQDAQTVQALLDDAERSSMQLPVEHELVDEQGNVCRFRTLVERGGGGTPQTPI